MAATETPTALGPCPTDEDLAAFLDGMLPEAERSRVIAHLADCRKCYRIFAESVHFLEGTEATGEEAAIVQFPFAEPKEQKRQRTDRRGAIRWWVTAAAAAVLAVAVGYGGYRAFFAPRLSVSELTAELPSKSESAKHLYPFSVFRGIGNGSPQDSFSDRPSFMVGVLIVDLALAPYAKDPGSAASGILQQIGKELKDSPLIDDREVARYEQDAKNAKDSVAFVRQLAADLPQREKELDEFLASDNFAFGKWAEAGRLAAADGANEFFTSRHNRRFLSDVLTAKEKEKVQAERQKGEPSNDVEFDPEVEREEVALGILQRIQSTLERGDQPTESDFRELIRLYEAAG